MHSHGVGDSGLLKTTKNVALIGNPNVGKSVLFRNLTGKYATVSNYPGTTVEITTGELRNASSERVVVIDTPGTNSLIPSSDDERITKRIVFEEKPEVIIQVGDMKNLRRTLHLTYQLITLLGSSIPIILALNMEDEARKRAIQINIKKLESFLGITVVSTTAIKNIGTEELVTNIKKAFEGHSNEINLKRNYSPEINLTLRNIEKILRERNTVNPGGEAEMILRGDEELLELIQLQSSIDVKGRIKKILNNAQSKFAKPLPLVLTEIIDKEIAEVVRSSSMVGLRTRRSVSEFIDDLTLNAFSGTLIFLSTLFLVFYFVGMIGAGEIVNFVESVIFGEYINPMLIQLVEALIPLSILQALLVGEYGVITFGLTYAVGIVFPVVTAFFIAFSILEDSGYLPRLAFLGDKLFRKIGLNGKAVLPLVLGTGFDCYYGISSWYSMFCTISSHLWYLNICVSRWSSRSFWCGSQSVAISDLSST
ncbi:MAG: FeoB small GTPase domain-containing protein [Candidatus Hodarchaeales archaeon]|jgi:ferrous iron transport protein B